MQLIKDIAENRNHDIKEPGAYEWWYFDGIDLDNEYSFVIIFYTGNPFSSEHNKLVRNHLKHPEIKEPDPMDFCALSLNLYYDERMLYNILYECEKDQFIVERERGVEKICLDKCNFHYNREENKYYININLSSVDIENKFKAEFIFSPVCNTSGLRDIRNVNGSDRHFWLPGSAACEMTGKLKFNRNFKRTKTEFTGMGSHFHNWGNEAMFINIREWYWGRAMNGEYSLVFNYVLYDEKFRTPYSKLLIYKKDELIYEIDEFDVNTGSKKGYWFLNSRKNLTIKTKDITMVCNNKIRIDEGLFLSRYISKFDLIIKDKKVLSEVTGFSEYLKPKPIKSGLFR